MKSGFELRCCVAPALLAVTAVAALALVARFGVLENPALAHGCSVADAAAPAWCVLKAVLVELFTDQRIGWFSLACALPAFVSSHRGLAWAACLAGVAGLVLYSQDPAAVGVLSAALVLLRPPQHGGKGKSQSGQQPGDRLGVGRFG